MSASVYALLDPRDGSARYVGSTNQSLRRRAISHHAEARKGGMSARARWLRDLMADSLRACPILLQGGFSIAEAEIAEGVWVHRLRTRAEPLLNERDNFSIPKIPSVWNEELDALLGVIHDEGVARLAGVTRKAVAYRREILGIGACRLKPRRPPGPPKAAGWNRIEIPPAFIDRLGSVPDHVLAAELGITKGVIARVRRARGIRPFAEATGCDGRYKPGNFPARWKNRR